MGVNLLIWLICCFVVVVVLLLLIELRFTPQLSAAIQYTIFTSCLNWNDGFEYVLWLEHIACWHSIDTLYSFIQIYAKIVGLICANELDWHWMDGYEVTNDAPLYICSWVKETPAMYIYWIEIISKLSHNTPTNQIINSRPTTALSHCNNPLKKFKSTKLYSNWSAFTLQRYLQWQISKPVEIDVISIRIVELFIRTVNTNSSGLKCPEMKEPLKTPISNQCFSSVNLQFYFLNTMVRRLGWFTFQKVR